MSVPVFIVIYISVFYHDTVVSVFDHDTIKLDVITILSCRFLLQYHRAGFDRYFRYSVNLEEAKRVGIKKGLVNGLGMGSVFLCMFCAYALAFWYGSTLIREGKGYTVGKMLTVSYANTVFSFIFIVFNIPIDLKL